uniref:Glycine-rich protein n=1 Tax=Globodera rostochiensis TaxID=31243 RepID=A0A914ICN1_GLORO
MPWKCRETHSGDAVKEQRKPVSSSVDARNHSWQTVLKMVNSANIHKYFFVVDQPITRFSDQQQARLVELLEQIAKTAQKPSIVRSENYPAFFLAMLIKTLLTVLLLLAVHVGLSTVEARWGYPGGGWGGYPRWGGGGWGGGYPRWGGGGWGGGYPRWGGGGWGGYPRWGGRRWA